MKIYNSEKELGLENRIQSNLSLSYACPVLINDKVESKLAVAGFDEFFEKVRSDLSLFPIFSILVSTVWNKNDDVFLPEEVWKARFTPEDKPFNIQHEPRRIIGHITSNIAITDDYEVMSDEILLEELPDKYHILTSSVIYTHANSIDNELTEKTGELIQEIMDGKYFVSMECVLNNFDYILDNGIEKKIIERNENTSFLTKHLRCYGGSGEYNGQKIGRVLRDITFSGKGLVENPGNEDSVIFNVDDNLLDLIKTEVVSSVQSNKKDNKMADTNYNEKLEKEIAQLTAALKEKDEKINSLGEAHVKAQIEAKDSEISELSKSLDEYKEKTDELETVKSELEKFKIDSEKQIKEKTEAYDNIKKELDTIKAESKKISRISTLVDAGLEKGEADKIVEKFADASDEMFDEIVELQKQIVESKKYKDEDEDKDKNDKNSKSDDELDKDGEKSAADSDLDSDDDNDIVVGSEDDESNEKDDTAQALASVMKSMFGLEEDEK